MKRALKIILTLAVDLLAKLKGRKFPEKFSWRWKLEMLSGRYEKNVVAACARIIKPGMTIIDIGAHIGYFTAIFSKLVGPTGKVYAFEADIENFQLLKENSKKLNNVILINKAVSEHGGSINFYHVRQSTGCHSIIPAENSEKTTVTATSLDEFTATQNIGQVDFIKIDIEGAEPLAFAGMKKLFSSQNNLQIIMEFFPEALKKSGVEPFKFLSDLAEHFKLYEISAAGALSPLILKQNNPDFYNSGCANLLLKKSS